MTRDDLLLLVEFNYWARDRMLDAVEGLTPEQFLRPLGNSFPSVRDTIVHLYSAEWVWFSRLEGESPTQPLSASDYPDLPAIVSAWKETEGKWRTYLGGLGADGHRTVIDYRLMNGQSSQSPLWQIVQHVVNHGTYHRGQVITMLRQLGAKPIGTDLITFHRERTIQR